MIARCPCTPQGPMEARGEKIVSSGPSKEIAGLKKMMMPRWQDSRVWEFSEALKVRRGPLGLCVGSYMDLWSVLVSF